MSNSYKFSTTGMQETGIHFMNANNKQKHEINAEDLKRAQQKAQEEQIMYVNNIMELDKDCKSYEDKTINPIGNRVVVKPYEKNPYRVPIKQRSSGLIYGDFDTAGSFKNPDTGEQEAAERGIWCCQVIAVGSECKYVSEGDDVYINFPMAAPLPFGGLEYYSIGEPNILCSIRPKNS